MWALTFFFRLFIHVEPISNDSIRGKSNAVVEKIIKSADNNDKTATFELILTNNLKGCLINVFGGVLLSVATVGNLLVNGFAAADVFRNAYDSGFPLTSILKTTLPHSFELLGFWLSGMIGFMITWQLIRFMKGKKSIFLSCYKTNVYSPKYYGNTYHRCCLCRGIYINKYDEMKKIVEKIVTLPKWYGYSVLLFYSVLTAEYVSEINSFFIKQGIETTSFLNFFGGSVILPAFSRQ